MNTSTSSETTPAGGPAATPAAEPKGDGEDSIKFFASHARLDAEDDGYASSTSFRFAPPPQRWPEILLTVGVLYGTFVGLPALAGLWAAWKIWQQVRG